MTKIKDVRLVGIRSTTINWMGRTICCERNMCRRSLGL